MEYKMVCSVSIDGFAKEVQKYIDEGHQLYGNPFFTGTLYCQAVIKQNTNDKQIGLGSVVGSGERV